MATVTQDVREVALLVEREPSNVWVFAPLREVAELNESTTVKPFTAQREVAQLNDSATGVSFALLTEIAQLDDLLAGSVRRVRTLREVAQFKSRAIPQVRVTATLREVAQVNDVALLRADLTLRDTALLNDTVSPSSRASPTLRETAQLLSRHATPASLTVRDTATLNDAAAPRNIAGRLERDVAQLNDILTARVLQRAELRDVAQLSDRIATIVQGGAAVLRDIAYLADNPSPPSYGRAYTCSIVTWGMSTLSNFKFTTMAGNFAAGQNLWRLDADDDYGAPISSHITTGVLDMGASQNKRLTAVYVAGTADDELTLTVIGDVDGQKASYNYPLEVRDQGDYRNNRTLIGKGFRSRFVQFKIGATAIKYRLLSAEADVSVTARRL